MTDTPWYMGTADGPEARRLDLDGIGRAVNDWSGGPSAIGRKKHVAACLAAFAIDRGADVTLALEAETIEVRWPHPPVADVLAPASYEVPGCGYVRRETGIAEAVRRFSTADDWPRPADVTLDPSRTYLDGPVLDQHGKPMASAVRLGGVALGAPPDGKSNYLGPVRNEDGRTIGHIEDVRTDEAGFLIADIRIDDPGIVKAMTDGMGAAYSLPESPATSDDLRAAAAFIDTTAAPTGPPEYWDRLADALRARADWLDGDPVTEDPDDEDWDGCPVRDEQDVRGDDGPTGKRFVRSCRLKAGHDGDHDLTDWYDPDDVTIRAFFPTVGAPRGAVQYPGPDDDEAERFHHLHVISEAREALRLTREYVGDHVLPKIEGWSWYDAYRACDRALGEDTIGLLPEGRLVAPDTPAVEDVPAADSEAPFCGNRQGRTEGGVEEVRQCVKWPSRARTSGPGCGT